MKSRLIGRVAYITDVESIYYDEWGVIYAYDGEYYYIGIAGDKDNLPVFRRNEFYIPRNRK